MQITRDARILLLGLTNPRILPNANGDKKLTHFSECP
jgi:hypothetical protein